MGAKKGLLTEWGGIAPILSLGPSIWKGSQKSPLLLPCSYRREASSTEGSDSPTVTHQGLLYPPSHLPVPRRLPEMEQGMKAQFCTLSAPLPLSPSLSHFSNKLNSSTSISYSLAPCFFLTEGGMGKAEGQAFSLERGPQLWKVWFSRATPLPLVLPPWALISPCLPIPGSWFRSVTQTMCSTRTTAPSKANSV